MHRNPGRGAAATLVACLLVTLAAAQEGDKDKAPAKPKKDPRAKLAEPWPDADGLQKRREAAEQLPMFQSHEPFEFTLTADFKAVNKDRNPNSTKRFPAVLQVAGEDGQTRSIPVQLRTRGHTRLVYHCGFVPMRLELPKQETKGTPFEKQEDLKLGTHCHGSKEYEQYYLREYLAYRVLNVLTPRSFRVRLARASYVDSKTGETQKDRHAMLLEGEDDLARRLEGRIAELPRCLFSDLEPDTLQLMMLFQYMIGNTDFSLFALHNVRLVQDSKRVLYPIPYDFDYAGLVNAHYAVPAKALKLSTVQDRAYRGPCRTLEELQPVLDRIRDKKAEVMALADGVPGMDGGSRRFAKRYLEEFYSALDDRGAIRRAVAERCQKSGM